MSLAQGMHFFTGRVPNDCHFAYLSNKALSYYWVASIFETPYMLHVHLCSFRIKYGVNHFLT